MAKMNANSTDKAAAKPGLLGRVTGGSRAAVKTPPSKASAGKQARAVGPTDRRLPRFLREVRIEMGKVTWPPRPELIQATSVVIVAVAIAAAYIGLLDLVWSSLVNLVRLS